MNTTPGEAGPRVLVVDDEQSILDFVEMGLQYEGFEVELARDGPGALAAVAARRPDLVVLDPPRSGAGLAVTRALAASGARAITYVACDPASLARDVAAFEAAGHRLTNLRAFDAFPMTAHVECVALLEPATG